MLLVSGLTLLRSFSISLLILLVGSKVDKLSKILIKTLNAAEYTETDTQNIEAL